MNDLESQLRIVWNDLECLVTSMLAHGHTDEARVVSKCAATIRALQSAMTAASEESEVKA